MFVLNLGYADYLHLRILTSGHKSALFGPIQNPKSYSVVCGSRGAGHRKIRDSELVLEREASLVIGGMPFAWLPVEDEAGPESRRGHIERNSIALLSNRRKIAFVRRNGFGVLRKRASSRCDYKVHS